MKGFVLDEKQRDELARLNARQADRQLVAVPLADGRWALAADALGEGYWAGWQDFLKGLGEPVEIGIEQFLQAPGEAMQSERNRAAVAIAEAE